MQLDLCGGHPHRRVIFSKKIWLFMLTLLLVAPNASSSSEDQEEATQCFDRRFAPEPRGHWQDLLWRRMDGAIEHYWGQGRDGNLIKMSEMKVITDIQEKAKAEGPKGKKFDLDYMSIAHTYGEASTIGVRQMGQLLQLHRAESMLKPVTFMDIGCGVGKMVIQTYVEFPSVRRSIGIEVSKTRAKIGRTALAEWIRDGTLEYLRKSSLFGDSLHSAELASSLSSLSHPVNLTHEVQLLEGDMYEADVSEVTHIFTNSIAFCSDMMKKLAKKLSEEATNLQVVVSTNRFPAPGLPGFELAETSRIHMDWKDSGKGTSANVYRRSKGV
eukprot:TRINITY_DN81790_c0_g1_i1.p1 TRINITY_DN81790_c0_g1~~TRINITY_DN81790_c0_g1_i1.p1  ORF type:complete len:327 (-),score=38.78 TRINITY_DN81790_c0_g1_i1:228-1208(-)